MPFPLPDSIIGAGQKSYWNVKIESSETGQRIENDFSSCINPYWVFSSLEKLIQGKWNFNTAPASTHPVFP
jgi:hypothetical protein